MDVKDIIAAIGDLEKLEDLEKLKKAVSGRRAELCRVESGYTALEDDVKANPGINPARSRK